MKTQDVAGRTRSSAGRELRGHGCTRPGGGRLGIDQRDDRDPEPRRRGRQRDRVRVRRLLVHGQTTGGLNSGSDWDSATAGDQTVPADGTFTVVVNGGDGNDSITVLAKNTEIAGATLNGGGGDDVLTGADTQRHRSTAATATTASSGRRAST